MRNSPGLPAFAGALEFTLQPIQSLIQLRGESVRTLPVHSSFTRVTARTVAHPPCVGFVARLRPSRFSGSDLPPLVIRTPGAHATVAGFRASYFEGFLVHSPIQSSTLRYHNTLFSGFWIQCPSSGNSSSFEGTFCIWRAVNNCKPWPTGTR